VFRSRYAALAVAAFALALTALVVAVLAAGGVFTR
jgi:hypothetical protein